MWRQRRQSRSSRNLFYLQRKRHGHQNANAWPWHVYLKFWPMRWLQWTRRKNQRERQVQELQRQESCQGEEDLGRDYRQRLTKWRKVCFPWWSWRIPRSRSWRCHNCCLRKTSWYLQKKRSRSSSRKRNHPVRSFDWSFNQSDTSWWEKTKDRE